MLEKIRPQGCEEGQTDELLRHVGPERDRRPKTIGPAEDSIPMLPFLLFRDLLLVLDCQDKEFVLVLQVLVLYTKV